LSTQRGAQGTVRPVAAPPGRQPARTHWIGVCRPPPGSSAAGRKAVAASGFQAAAGPLPLGTTLRLGLRSGLIQECFPSQRPPAIIPSPGADCCLLSPQRQWTQQPAHQPVGLRWPEQERATLVLVDQSQLPWPDCCLRSLPKSPSGTRGLEACRPARGRPCRRAGPQPVPSRPGRRAGRVPDVPSRRDRTNAAAQFPGQEPTQGNQAEAPSLRDRKRVVHRPEPFAATNRGDLQHPIQASLSPLLPKSHAQGQGVWVVPAAPFSAQDGAAGGNLQL